MILPTFAFAIAGCNGKKAAAAFAILTNSALAFATSLCPHFSLGALYSAHAVFGN